MPVIRRVGPFPLLWRSGDEPIIRSLLARRPASKHLRGLQQATFHSVSREKTYQVETTRRPPNIPNLLTVCKMRPGLGQRWGPAYRGELKTGFGIQFGFWIAFTDCFGVAWSTSMLQAIEGEPSAVRIPRELSIHPPVHSKNGYHSADYMALA
jgi:hypothetical protein